MKTTRRLIAALVLVAVMAVLSGCGSSSSGGAGNGNGGSGGSGTVSKYEQAVKFAECIRTHGDPSFADPNSSGEFVGGIGVSPAAWQQAVDACKALEPPGSLSGERTPEQQSAALKFAQCMRTNGVSDFPDPTNGQPLIDTTKIPSVNQPGGRSILNAAMQKCRSVLGAAAGGQ